MSPASKSNNTQEQELWEPYLSMQRDRNAWLVVHTDALHVCNRREAFIAFQETKAFTVSTNSDKPNLGLNKTYTARGIGQTKIMFRTLDGRSHERILTDVLHVPDAFANFVSLPRLFWPAEESYRLDKKRGLAYSAGGRDLAWFPPDFQGLLCLALRSETPHFPGPSAFLRRAPTINFEVHTDGFPQPHFINTASKLEMAFRHLTLLDESEVDEMERWGNEKVDLTVSDIVGVINSQVDKAQTSWETAVLSCPAERCHYRGSFAYRGTSGFSVCSNESLLKNLVPIPPMAANNPVGPAAVAKGDLVLEIAKPDGSPGKPIHVDHVLFIPNWYGNYLTHDSLFGPGKAFEGGTFDKKTGVAKDKHRKEVAWFTKCHDDDTWVLKRPDKPTFAGTPRFPPGLPLPVNPPRFQSESQKAVEPTVEKKRKRPTIKNNGAGTLLPLTTSQSNIGAGEKWNLSWTEDVANHPGGKSGDQKNSKQSKQPILLVHYGNGKENVPPGAAPKEASKPAPGPSTPRTSSQAVSSPGESSIAKISTPNRNLPLEETNAVLSDLEHRFSSKESLPAPTVTPKGLPPDLAQHIEPMIAEFTRLSTTYARLALTGRLDNELVVAYYEAVHNITSRNCDLAELANGYDGDEEEDEYAPSEHSSTCTTCPDDDELEALLDPFLTPVSTSETVVAEGDDVETPLSPSTSATVEGDDDRAPLSPSTNATIEVEETLVSPSNSVPVEGKNIEPPSSSSTPSPVEDDDVETRVSPSTRLPVEVNDTKAPPSSSAPKPADGDSEQTPLSKENRQFAELVIKKGQVFFATLIQDAMKGTPVANKVMNTLLRYIQEKDNDELCIDWAKKLGQSASNEVRFSGVTCTLLDLLKIEDEVARVAAAQKKESKSNEKTAAQQEDRPAQAAADESLRIAILRDRVAQLHDARDKVASAPDEPAYKAAVRDADRLMGETKELEARLGMASPQKPSQDKTAEQKANDPLPGKTAQANAAKAKAAASGSKTTKEQQLTPFEKAARAKAADILTHLNRKQADDNVARLSPTSLWDENAIRVARDTAVADWVAVNQRSPMYIRDVEDLLVMGAKNEASRFRKLYKDSEMAKEIDALSDADFAEMMAAGFSWRLNQLSGPGMPSNALVELTNTRKASQKISPGQDQYRVSRDAFYAGEVGARCMRFHPQYMETEQGKQYATMTHQEFGQMKAEAFLERVQGEMRPQLEGLNDAEYDRALLAEHGLWMGGMACPIQLWLTRRDGWVPCADSKDRKERRLLCIEELVNYAEARMAKGKPSCNE